MRMFAVLTLVTFVPVVSCIDTVEGFKFVKEQERVVIPLLSEVKTLPQDQIITDNTKIRYEEALQKTKTMIQKANEVTEQVSSGGDEIGDETDDAELLHCSTVNSLRKMIELNEILQKHVSDEEKIVLAQQLAQLKESLK